MLILPPGHARAVRTRRRLTRREKWMVRTGAAVIGAIAVVLAISLATSAGPKSSRGCIYALLPGPVGAQQFHQCGAAARATCGSVFRPGAFTPDAAGIVAADCRGAGLPVGR